MTNRAQEKLGLPLYSGFRDLDGRFIPFPEIDKVLRHAQSLGVRTLLRLSLNRHNELEGLLCTNEQSLIHRRDPRR